MKMTHLYKTTHLSTKRIISITDSNKKIVIPYKYLIDYKPFMEISRNLITESKGSNTFCLD